MCGVWERHCVRVNQSYIDFSDFVTSSGFPDPKKSPKTQNNLCYTSHRMQRSIIDQSEVVFCRMSCSCDFCGCSYKRPRDSLVLDWDLRFSFFTRTVPGLTITTRNKITGFACKTQMASSRDTWLH